MLVLVPAEVVLAILVSPVERLREVLVGEKVPAVGSLLDLTVLEEGLLNAAAVELGEEGLFLELASLAVELILGEGIDSLVVLGIVLLLISGLVPHLVGPGVDWGGPGAVGLDGDVVDATAHAEEAFFSPGGAPGVTDVPELLAVFIDAPADDGDQVDELLIASIITVDTTSVLFEGLWHGNVASDGTTLVNLLHHLLLSVVVAELVNLEDAILVWHIASLTWSAVSALAHGRALCLELTLGPP